MTVTVLVMDGAEARSPALQTELTAQTVDVARLVTGADPHRAPPGRSLTDAVADLHGEDPLLVLWPAVPRLGREHVEGALDDLQAGCDVVFGPLMGGGFYLLAFSGPMPDVLAAIEASPSRDDATAAALSLAGSNGLEIGYLKPERPLYSEADVAAALADPLTPESLVRLLKAQA